MVSRAKQLTVYLASDHGGWRVKRDLSNCLQDRGFRVRDLGPNRLVTNDDYPVWAARLARQIQHDPTNRGILICRSGIGMAMAANKFSGVRAAQVFSPRMAIQSRRDENTNILSLAADYHSFDEIKRITLDWLQTKYKPQARFQRRLRQLARIEHAR